MSLLGFDALGRLALGQFPGGLTTTVLQADAGAFALTGNAATFTIIEAVPAGSFVLAGVSISFKVTEAIGAGAYAMTGNGATFLARENVAAGSFLLNGSPVVDLLNEQVQAGSFTLTGNDAPLTRTGADFDLVYGGIGHYLLERERARQLEKITRKTPAPIDRTTRPVFAPIGRPPVSAPAPGPDLAAIQNQRMADEMRASAQAATAKRRRKEMEMLLLIA